MVILLASGTHIWRPHGPQMLMREPEACSPAPDHNLPARSEYPRLTCCALRPRSGQWASTAANCKWNQVLCNKFKIDGTTPAWVLNEGRGYERGQDEGG
jgi:hypothetical protein